MNKETADKLTEVTLQFYEQEASSFSATRTKPWAGWYRCADIISRYFAAKSAFSSNQNGAYNTGNFATAPNDAQCSGQNQGLAQNIAQSGAYQSGSQNQSFAQNDNSYIELLDLACGNLRFERFMIDEHPEIALSVNAVDSEEALVFDLMKSLDSLQDLNYQHLNITQALKTERELENTLEAPICDISVCFGFLHHVPQSLWRKRLLQALIKRTCKKGLIMVTFWQFADSATKLAKLQESTKKAAAELKIDIEELADNDFILGWQNKANTWRYCHYFDDEEIKQIVSFLEKMGNIRLASTFCADGKTGKQNRYIILERL